MGWKFRDARGCDENSKAALHKSERSVMLIRRFMKSLVSMMGIEGVFANLLRKKIQFVRRDYFKSV